MKNLRSILFFGFIVIGTLGCNKNGDEVALPPSKVQLLTDKPWKLITYGIDFNKNGTVDMNEEAIRECDRDNTYTFNTNGTGVVKENVVICNGNQEINSFNWTLDEDDTLLDFIDGKTLVKHLSANSMILAIDGQADEPMILLIYKH